jgi:hypothetical protein
MSPGAGARDPGMVSPSANQQAAAREKVNQGRLAFNAASSHGGELFTTQLFSEGVQMINEMMLPLGHEPNPVIKNGIDALLSSLVFGLWTACEVWLTDLWIRALNEGPKRLVKNVLNDTKHKLESESSGSQAKQIQISVIADYGYDLRKRMGDLLRDNKKVDFQSFRNTQRAYLAAFRDSIRPLVQETDRAYANVMILSAIRNVLLHRRAKVDREFKAIVRKAVGNTLPSITALNEGDRVAVRGGMLKELHTSVVDLCTKLMRFVDQEITRE